MQPCEDTVLCLSAEYIEIPASYVENGPLPCEDTLALSASHVICGYNDGYVNCFAILGIVVVAKKLSETLYKTKLTCRR